MSAFVASPIESVLMFVVGVLVVVWATERLLEGLVGLAFAAHLSTFIVAVVLSGLEAENIAVGLAAGAGGIAAVALGSVFGGAIFVVCVALGLGAVLYPTAYRFAPICPGCIRHHSACRRPCLARRHHPSPSGNHPSADIWTVHEFTDQVRTAHQFVDANEIEESATKPSRWLPAIGLTALGVIVISVGGEMVAIGAEQMILSLGVSAAVVGMVVTPAAIEFEEVVRQAVPTREGHPEVSAGNLVGTLLYFVLFNLGLIALLTPVQVDSKVRQLDWPFLVGTTWLATAFLARGRIGRLEGAALVFAYCLYVVAQVTLGS
jgi:cation:H+ antiporter